MSIRTRLLTGIVAGAALTMGWSGPSAAASHSHAITRGDTTVTLSHLGALDKAGLALHKIDPATKEHGDLTLPATGGTVDLPKYEIEHDGGFAITDGSSTVEITQVTLRTKSQQATAKVTGQGRLVALEMGDPNRGNGGPHFAEFAGYTLTYSTDVIRLLDHTFGTQFFKNHPELGVGDSTVHFRD